MKVGILGAGAIAEVLSRTINEMSDAECYAIASRSIEKAEKFKEKFNFQKAYGSYEELVKDPLVDLVYIATPHSRHFEDMKLCIEHKKAVLCEKSFTVNAAQAREIKELAHKNNVFVTEAIWTRYMPSRKLIKDTIDSGIIGDVDFITANLSYANSKIERMYNPNLAGGSLLDLGVYGINFVSMIFGDDIQRIDSSVIFTDTGVDGKESITMIYPNAKMATITHNFYSRGDRKGIIHGEKGYMVVENINNPNSIKVFDIEDKLIKEVEIPKQITGYEYQVMECNKCLKEGRIESYSMPLDETIKIMDVMDSIRKDWNMKYPFE